MTTKRVTKGQSFGPTYDGQGDDNSSTDLRKKRGRSDTKSDPCIVCGYKNHEVTTCYYAYPDRAPESFKPNPKTKEKADANLKKKEVKDKIQKAKGKRAKSAAPEPNEPEPSTD